MKKDLENKIIIVTGGSGLLGKSIIHSIMNKGAKVINLDIQNFSDSQADFIKCDIRDEHSTKSGINEVINRYGRIDGLVNNAYPRTDDWGASFDEISKDSWKTNMDWQLNSHVAITQHVIQHMKNSNGGSIVFMGSIYGMVGNDLGLYEGTKIKTAPPYSAIKGALINFTKYLASAYGQENIRVNCVSPGGVYDNQDPTFVSRYEKRVPLKRMATPDDIAPSVSFLLSEEAQYITGHNLVVDGGWTSI